MFERLSRSWSLVKASAGILRSDRELLLFPMMSAIATLLVAASFFVPIGGFGLFAELRANGGDAMPIWFWPLLFVFYVVQYTVIFFFNTALVGAAMMRLDGHNPTVADGLRIASAKLPMIIGYAVMAATVGMLLRAVQERAGFIGRWVVGLIGVAWTVATFLVVPVLVHENIGPVDAVKRSAELLKKTWGENIAGNVGIGLVFGLLTMLAILAGVAVTVAVATNGGRFWTALPVVATVLAVLALTLVQAAMQGVYSAVLYRYAATGDTGQGFDRALIETAFKVKA